MWTPVLVLYAFGLFVTGVTLYRTQIFKSDYVMHFGSIVLWPLYWIFYLLTLFQNRRRP
jgi:hypothetical protein